MAKKKESVAPPVPPEEVLKGFTDQMLAAEIERRKNEAEELEAVRIRKRSEWMLKHIDALLEIVDKHDRTSCDDKHPDNAISGRCSRCMLLSAKRDEYAYDLTMDFTVMLIEKREVR